MRPIPERQRRLSQADWNRLLELAHRDKRRAFEEFAAFYLATSGQLYWSDTHQLNLYLETYHERARSASGHVRSRQRDDHGAVRAASPSRRIHGCRTEDFRTHQVDFIYGTIRLIERDSESALPWARDRYACVIFNLHIDHLPQNIVEAREAFKRLIDHAMAFGGSYYLTYHRFARRDQLLTCHPGIEAFLSAKHRFDPAGMFQSDWYRHIAGQVAAKMDP